MAPVTVLRFRNLTPEQQQLVYLKLDLRDKRKLRTVAKIISGRNGVSRSAGAWGEALEIELIAHGYDLELCDLEEDGIQLSNRTDYARLRSKAAQIDFLNRLTLTLPPQYITFNYQGWELPGGGPLRAGLNILRWPLKILHFCESATKITVLLREEKLLARQPHTIDLRFSEGHTIEPRLQAYHVFFEQIAHVPRILIEHRYDKFEHWPATAMEVLMSLLEAALVVPDFAVAPQRLVDFLTREVNGLTRDAQFTIHRSVHSWRAVALIVELAQNYGSRAEHLRAERAHLAATTNPLNYEMIKIWPVLPAVVH
ncbi:unnamed protein product, partial [Mesorhabditis spiculigera]